MQEIQKQFENWYEASIKPLEISYLFKQENGGYTYTPVADAWEVWQAAFISFNNTPMYVWRKCDNERFTRQSNGKFTLDSSNMYKPYEYCFHDLMNNIVFTTIDPT